MSPDTLHRTAAEGTRKPSRFDRWARSLIHKRLRFLEQGSLTLVDAMGTARFGDPLSSLSATIQIRELGLYRSIALGGTLAAAESYMDSDWDSEDLTAVIRIPGKKPKNLLGVRSRPHALERSAVGAISDTSKEYALRKSTQYCGALRPRKPIL